MPIPVKVKVLVDQLPLYSKGSVGSLVIEIDVTAAVFLARSCYQLSPWEGLFLSNRYNSFRRGKNTTEIIQNMTTASFFLEIWYQ